MDKLESGKTITIKINGKNQPFIDEQAEKGSQMETEPAKSTADLHAKPEAHQEVAASKEAAEESFDWIFPEAETGIPEIATYKKVNNAGVKTQKLSAAYKKDHMQKRPIKTILFSTIFAVLIGTSFGMLMLKLVVMNPSKPAVVEPPAAGNQAAASPSSSSESAVLKAFTTYVVQEGVYTLKKSAEDISKLAVQKGLPAKVVEINGQNFLFLGIANSLEAAKGMENVYKGKGVNEPYSKALAVPEKKLTNVSQAEKIFSEAMPAYFLTISKAAANAMASADVPANLQKDLASISIDEKQVKNKQLKSLATALAGANEQLKEFQKSKNQQAIVKAQQDLLTFLQLYYSL
ncbi:hypothetical protein ACQYAD_15780 [Neobacillus sp. SM06]|uniref:hypothetical protein n=1 Tax=Neobacillus sp. SM06 TaxID=3422492 RepID=UPI003D266F16